MFYPSFHATLIWSDAGHGADRVYYPSTYSPIIMCTLVLLLSIKTPNPSPEFVRATGTLVLWTLAQTRDDPGLAEDLRHIYLVHTTP